MSLSYVFMPSPVGDLKLICQRRRLGRSPMEEGPSAAHPFARISREPYTSSVASRREGVERIFLWEKNRIYRTARHARNAFSKTSLGGSTLHPFRRDSQLRPNREATRQAQRHSRRRRGEWPKPDSHYRSMPPRHRIHRFTHGLRRRTRAKGSPPQAGRTHRNLVRLTVTRQALRF
jgi:hypothetical protein